MLNATRVLMALLGGTIGYYSAWHLVATGVWPTATDHPWAVLAVGSLVMASLGAVLTRHVVSGVRRILTSFIAALQHTPTVDVAVGSIGLISGLIIGILATLPLPRSIPVVGSVVPVVVTLVLGYVGAMVAVRKRDDVMHMFSPGGRLQGRDRSTRVSKRVPKIVDTSVIIDGRIADIVQTGFLEGPLVVPRFVLTELQHIADSSDVLKRNRGRRGLDILNRIQKESRVQVQVIERDFEELSDVDSKLVRLAKLLEGNVVTNDFNLNKVAELQGVRVLNINELVNAVKPLVLPGEEMVVHLIKDGKEQGQGVGYLDDGTMIVVDGGRRYIGESIGVLVTNVLQTNAGRMIFAKPKVMERAL
ncbi:MAG: PIN/TRAM domain-containing protein [Limnochordia bacterium]|jgi:uncharacterized protein YacL